MSGTDNSLYLDMKTLLVLRHGHAEQLHKATPQDFDRALSERGREEAHKSGRKAASLLRSTPHILASEALRTRQTAQCFAQELGEIPFYTAPHLYRASVEDWLEELLSIDESVESVVFVGHNPAISELCTRLSGREVDLHTGGLKGFVTQYSWDQAGHKPWEELVFP